MIMICCSSLHQSLSFALCLLHPNTVWEPCMSCCVVTIYDKFLFEFMKKSDVWAVIQRFSIRLNWLAFQIFLSERNSMSQQCKRVQCIVNKIMNRRYRLTRLDSYDNYSLPWLVITHLTLPLPSIPNRTRYSDTHTVGVYVYVQCQGQKIW